MVYADLNQEQAEALQNQAMVALLPLGAVEVHGNHLPLGTDVYLAEALAEEVEQRLGKEVCLRLPCIPYGQVWSLRDAPGSIDIPNEVLSHYIAAVGESLHRAGIRKLAIINSHVGNQNAMKTAARILYESCDIKVYLFTYPGAEEQIAKVCTAPPPHKGYFHACEIETSYMLYLCPEKVNMEKAICQYPAFPEAFDYTPVPWTAFMKTAVLGDATKASAEKGEIILDFVVKTICNLLKG